MKLAEGFNLLATAPDGIKRLRELILSLAVQGKLVPQDPSDEPASELLKQIRAEKDQLIAAGKIKKDKPLPAISGDDISYELPPSWSVSNLGGLLVRISNGYSGKQDKTKNAYPVTRIETISKSVVDMARVGYCQDISTADVEKYRLCVGDILMSHINSGLHVGKTAVIASDSLLIHGVNLLLLRPSSLVSSSYLDLAINYHRLSGYFERIAQHAIGQASINQGKVVEVPINVPPSAEQSRIVAKVEELMALCDALETRGQLEAEQHARLTSTLFDALAASESAHQLQENWARLAASFDLVLDRPEAVDALEQTLLQLAVRGLLVPQDPNDEPASELLKQIRAEKDRLIAEGKIKKDKPLPVISDEEKPFELPQGWEWALASEIATQITDGAHHTPQYVPEGIPFLSVKNLSSGYMDFSDTRFISQEAHDDLIKRCNPELGDILLTKIGTTGIAVVIDDPRPFSIFVSVALLKLPSPQFIIRNYLALLINSPFVRQQSADGTEGVGNKNLVLKKINSFKLPIPPLAEQSRIVARVEALRALCGQLRERLAACRQAQAHLAEALVAQT